MDMQGSRHLAIGQQEAWQALNDPEVLKACIPGCDRFEATGENQYAAGMAVRVGPVSARFNGKLQLSEVNPPTSYRINFEGQGGPAGFGKGSASVQLAPAAQGCDLSYTATAQVGGKIAQVGQRLIDGVAKSMADDFFARFDAEMQKRYPAAYAAAPAETPAAAESAAQAKKPVPQWVWIVGAIVVLGIVWMLAR
jgi:carbon monoxide dehydrogenase subunit G